MSLQVTIGTAPCSWGVWWPDGTPSGTPYNVFLDQAAEAGYKALELGPVGYLPTDIGQLRDELASHLRRHRLLRLPEGGVLRRRPGGRGRAVQAAAGL